MLNGFFKKICSLSILGAGGLMLGSCSFSLSEQVLDKTPITINIPAKLSNDILSITLPRCALKINEERFEKNDFEADSLTLLYDFYVYSGNLKNIFPCPTNLGQGSIAEIKPIYPLADGQPIINGYDYFVKFDNALGRKVKSKNDFAELRNLDASQEMLLVNGMKNQTRPFQFDYMKYDGSVNSVTSYHYDVETIIFDKFRMTYSFLILIPENRKHHNLSNHDTDFAKKFRDVVQSNGNVLDHSELIQGFVDNNERVVKFIESNSKLSKKTKN